MRFNLQWSAGQFSDSPPEQENDAQAIFDYAETENIHAIGGSEDNQNLPNLKREAHLHGFRFHHSTRQDTWQAVHKGFGFSRARFIEVVPAVHRPAAQGGHGARGLFLVTIKPVDKSYGPAILVATTHFVLWADRDGPHGNQMIDRKAGQVFHTQARGKHLGFMMGDLNTDDQHSNGFNIAPLHTCWDDLGKYPPTHPDPNGNGPTLDVVARYDLDRRVSLANAQAVPELHLHSDHTTITAAYDVRALNG